MREWLNAHPFRLLGWMIVALFILLALLLTAAVRADTLAVSWTAPTQREDGSALLGSEIAGYRLSWSVNGAAQPDKTVTGTSYVLDTGALVGRVCLVMRTIDSDGLESEPTGEVCRKARPKPPANVRAR